MAEQQTRIEYLLQRISEEFKEMNYIDGNFTVREDIAADDAVTVFPLAGDIIAGFLALPFEERFRIIALSKGLDPKMAKDIQDGYKFQNLVKTIIK